jgi:hypothetical protein
LSARSSPNTPAVFFAAILLMTATSSKTVAISSNNINKLLAIPVIPKGSIGYFKEKDSKKLYPHH